MLKKAFFKFQLICLKSHVPNVLYLQNKNKKHSHALVKSRNICFIIYLFIIFILFYFRKVTKVESLNWTFLYSFVAEPNNLNVLIGSAEKSSWLVLSSGEPGPPRWARAARWARGGSTRTQSKSSELGCSFNSRFLPSVVHSLSTASNFSLGSPSISFCPNCAELSSLEEIRVPEMLLIWPSADYTKCKT